jgi:uridine nucleosidase
VYPGASKPLIVPAKADPEIHGADGLGGVEGLPSIDDPIVLSRFHKSKDGSHTKALDGMSKAIKEVWKSGSGQKVTVISSGPMTNIALFVSVYPELLGRDLLVSIFGRISSDSFLDAVEEFVFMGGGVGLGNVSLRKLSFQVMILITYGLYRS